MSEIPEYFDWMKYRLSDRELEAAAQFHRIQGRYVNAAIIYELLAARRYYAQHAGNEKDSPAYAENAL